MEKVTRDYFAEVELRPHRDGKIGAYVGGKYLGVVRTDDDGNVSVLIAAVALRPRGEPPKEIYGGLLPSEAPFP